MLLDRSTTMKSGLGFLVSALQSEIDELEQLARTSALVVTIGRLVHALQRERGLSNVWLGSGGGRFAAERAAQIAQSQALEQAVHLAFERLAGEDRRLGNGARLFSRIAFVLPGLDALPELRRRIGAQELDTAAATAAFAKLIAGLLAVVFEAADGASDPQISRRLVGLFNFMQGKEFAGQERACGAAAFAAGRCGGELRRQWLQLIGSQERCFELFAEFSDAAPVARWRAIQADTNMASLERLRRIACAGSEETLLDTELSPAWFDCCTRRIDAMQSVEEDLARALRALCEEKTARARAELQSREALLDAVGAAAAPGAGENARAAFSFFLESPAPADDAAPYGRQLQRSILELVQEQSRRLQSMGDELETVRAALNERKLVERAKGLLMAHRRISEEEAHRWLRQTAMNQHRRLAEVAESVLAMAGLLAADGPP